MNYSFSTVLMTILAGNLLIVVMGKCVRSQKIMLSIGYKLVAVFLMLAVLRFLVPFETPFSRNVYFPKWLSAGIVLLRHPFFTFGIIKISISSIFGCVWLGGTVYYLYRYFKAKSNFRHYIIRYGQKMNNQEPYKAMMDEICGKGGNSLWVVKVPYYGTPMQYGTFRPYIVIPGTMDFSDEEVYCILRHEAAHYKRHDTLIKDAMCILQAVYWWNPLSRQMGLNTDLLLEMRVDKNLIEGSEASGEIYCRTLDRINEEIRGKSVMPGADAAIPVADVRSEDLERRQDMMRGERRRRGFLSYSLAAVALLVYIGSYCFTLEASYDFHWVDYDGAISSTDDCFCAVSKADGTYDIYLYGHFIENVDTLKLYAGISVMDEQEWAETESAEEK
ncbi:MAG: M56 family metallopeptidase [Butyrivibrio sp.]|nr:M56 family metallopeptidase [Acetatifactor muris]MCM1559865.1 M56 family metallopeptidase [Butyrivibrio sp.]